MAVESLDWSAFKEMFSSKDVWVKPLIELTQDTIDLIPGLIKAVVLLAIGIFIAWIIGQKVVAFALEKLGLDREFDKLHLSKAIGGMHISGIIGKIIKWYIVIIFLEVAVAALGPGIGADLAVPLGRFVAFLPSVIAAVLIMLVGLLTGHYVWHFIETHSKMKGSRAAGALLKYAIIIMTVLVSLRTIGINVKIIEYAILVLLAGMALAIGLGLGLSFGLGLKGQAAGNWKKIKKQF